MKSPILDFALDSFEFALELFMQKDDAKTKFSLIHVDNSIELTLKAKLLESGISLYGENKKITHIS